MFKYNNLKTHPKVDVQWKQDEFLFGAVSLNGSPPNKLAKNKNDYKKLAYGMKKNWNKLAFYSINSEIHVIAYQRCSDGIDCANRVGNSL